MATDDGPREHVGGKELWIKRVAFPTFNGTQESWWDLKRLFKDLLKISKVAPVIETDQLFCKLPDEVKAIIIRVQEPAEAWGLLKESYEDTQITVSSAIHTLQTLKLLVKVEALMLAVMTAKDCLRVSQSLITKQES